MGMAAEQMFGQERMSVGACSAAQPYSGPKGRLLQAQDQWGSAHGPRSLCLGLGPRGAGSQRGKAHGTRSQPAFPPRPAASCTKLLLTARPKRGLSAASPTPQHAARQLLGSGRGWSLDEAPRSTPGPVVWWPAPLAPRAPTPFRQEGLLGGWGGGCGPTNLSWFSSVVDISSCQARSKIPGRSPPSCESLGACAAQPAPPTVPPFPVHSQGIGVQKLPAKPRISATGTKRRQPQESPICPPLATRCPPSCFPLRVPLKPPHAEPPCSTPMPTLWALCTPNPASPKPIEGGKPLTLIHGGGCPLVPYRSPTPLGCSGHSAPTPPTL